MSINIFSTPWDTAIPLFKCGSASSILCFVPSVSEMVSEFLQREPSWQHHSLWTNSILSSQPLSSFMLLCSPSLGFSGCPSQVSQMVVASVFLQSAVSPKILLMLDLHFISSIITSFLCLTFFFALNKVLKETNTNNNFNSWTQLDSLHCPHFSFHHYLLWQILPIRIGCNSKQQYISLIW